MNHISLTICLGVSLIFLGSCRKNKDAVISNSINGTWELRQRSGGMMAGANNYPAGNGNIIKFTDSLFDRYAGNQLTESGVYAVIHDTTVEENVCLVVPAGQFTNRIVYNGRYDSTKVFIQMTNNILTFMAGCYALDGGHSEQYERVENQQQKME